MTESSPPQSRKRGCELSAHSPSGCESSAHLPCRCDSSALVEGQGGEGVSRSLPPNPVLIPPSALRDSRSLAQWRIGNFDIGQACLSSLISLRRDPRPDLRGDEEVINRLAAGARQTWLATSALLARHRPDRVYVFNGRFAAPRAVLRACEAFKIECLIHERGCDSRHFQLYRNHLPHDIPSMERRIRAFWNAAASQTSRHRDARAWFHGRVARVERNWRSFVKQQDRGSLPEDWKPGRHNIVVFTSSEDEFAAIGDCWRNRLWPDQATALESIARELRHVRPDTHLTIRVHPNLAGIDNSTTKRLDRLQGENVSVIEASRAVDSYQLLRLADTVATFGSSIGIESVFWSRPSVLLGPCFYEQFRGPYRAESRGHAIRLLAADLTPAIRHEALLYGYWQQRHGIAFKHFEADDLFTGRFRGEIVWPRPRKSIGHYVAKPIRSLRKRIPLPRDRAA